MAQTAALQLGNLISSKISGTLGSFASGLKGSFIGANPAVFGPMVGTMGKMFSTQARAQKEAEQRRQGFEEERVNEQNKMFNDILSVMKGVASSLEAIQKDVRAILDILKEKGFLDKLGDFLKGLLASIPAGLGKLLDGIIDFLKAIPSRLGSVFDSIIDFLKAVPGKIADAFGGVIKFLSELPGKIMNMLTGAIDFLKAIPEKIGTLFSRIVGIFEDFINKYFPKTRDAIVKFFSGLADLLKLDKIKDFFSAIGTKFNNFIKLLDESEIGKAFRKIRNVFAISFAQYADELSDLFTNRIPQIFGNIKTAIGELGNRIMTSFDESIDLFKTSRVAQLGDELGGRISGAFGAVIDYIKSTKIGSIGADLGGIITSLFDDVKGLFKLPDVSNLGLFFDLGKSAQTFEEFKYVLGEGGVVEKGIATIGKFIGDIGRFFGGAFTTVTEVGSKVADLLAGPLKFFGELTDLAPMFRALGSLGKILGPLGVIFSVIDGLVAAFDTETLAKTLGKAAGDVTWKDRVAGFFGGVIGGVFGLFDLIVDLMGLEKGEESLQSKVTSLMTKGIREIMATFGNIIDLIVGVITFNPTKIADASQNLFDTVKNSFKALANVFIDGINWLIDKLPSWMQPEKLSRLDSAESAVAPAASPAASSANQTEATMARLGIKPNESAGGGRGSSQGSRGYTAGDLKSMGLNVRPYGDVQKPGGYIAGSTIEGAKKTQNLVPGITFTGFNDDYHDQHSPKSSHTKGLAFDFTIPPKAAMDNEFRKDIAQAISSATGAKVIDEYAFPSAKSTGGHFHVDFAGSKGVDLGTGYYRGEKTTNVTPPQPKGTEQPSSGGVDWANAPSESAMDRRLLGGGAPQIGTPAAPAQSQYTVVTRQKILTPEEALAYSQAIAYYDAEKKRYDEEKKYRDERAQLENKFYGDLESMVRPMVTALQGPAGSMDPALARDAGKNLARGMQEDFTRIGTALFGKQYGAAMGTTFQQLAGSYLDQFINQALAPAMGVDAEVLNRSINLYAKGKEFASKTLAPAQKALDDARAALQEKEKTSGLTQASIIRASGLGKKLTPEQLAKMTELETMRKGVKEQESKVDALKKQRRQYNQVALEDLFFGMTGVPTGARSLIEQYGGADALTRDLATMIGAPFSPAFHLGEKGPLAGPGVDPRIALDQRLKQTEQVLVEGGQVVAVKTVEGHKDGAVIVYDRVLEGHRAGAAILSDAITNSRVNLGSVTGSSMDVFTSAIGDGVKSAIGEIAPTFMGFDEVAGGGTSIPGYVDDGSYDRAEMAKFGRQTSAMGPSSTARLPVNTGKLMDFGQNMLYNMLGSKVSSAFGGGITGNIFGRAAQGALKGAFTGGDIVQNIGAQFGMKLAPGAGIGDLLGGVSSMFTNQITSMGSMFTNLATSKLMPGFMSQGVMDFGTGIQAAGGGLSGLTGAFGSGNLSHMAGAAAGGLMAGMQGYGISKALSGGYSTGGNTVNLLAGIGSAFFGPIAGVVGGLVNRAFGRKAKETKAAGFSGTFSTEGADIKQFTDWFQKGGWFRSDKRGTDFKAVDSETAKAFSDTVKDTTKTVEALAKSLGYDPTKTKGFSKAIKIDLKGLDEKQQQEAIQKAFKDYGASLVGASFKTVGKFTKTGEDQLDTLSRLANASQLFKSVMTGPDVKKILGLDNADTIKNLVSSQFVGVTNMDAAIKDYMAGGKGMMEAGGIGIPGLSTAFGNVFSKLNLDPVSDVAQNIVSAFTGSLQDQAGSLKEYLDTYVANFQSELIKAYGGEEEFQKVETSLFDLLYTDEEKRVKLQELTAAQMKEAAQNLKDAGVVIDPDKLGATFADNQKAAKDMLTAADKDLASGKITKEQYATIRKSAADFLTAAKKNSELSKNVSGGTSTFKAMTPEEAAKLVFPPGTLAPLQNTIAVGQANSVVAFTTAATTISDAATTSATTIADAAKTAVETGTTQISNTSASGANTISTSATSQAQVLERLITDFINSSGTFANAVNGLNGSIGTLENAVSNFEFGGAGGSEGSGGGTGEGVGSATGIGADGTDGGAGGTGGGGAASAGAVGGDGTDGGAGGSGSASGGDGGGGDGASAWAKGGWFRRRRPMIVGEVGPEVMVPDFAGTIVPTHKIIEAVQNAAALDSQTRNLLLNAAPAPNPVSIVYMDQENTNKALMKERDTAQNVNNAVVDNSVTQVSSPQTTVINGGGDVRSTHPISGMFTRAMIGARGF